VLLDFYADWCVSCKEMEKLTFIDPAVQQKLANTILLQVDVTENNEADKAMLQRFTLFGPPGIIMFNSAGQEIPDSRVIGFQDTGKFLRSLQKLN
jgi:thiol:disulfide interchange protein DsbD